MDLDKIIARGKRLRRHFLSIMQSMRKPKALKVLDQQIQQEKRERLLEVVKKDNEIIK